jgi:uncharacterized linocin/CFP29 family protein
VTPHASLLLEGDVRDLPRTVLRAQEVLRLAGVSGPYVLVLGAALHDQVYAATVDGYPLVKRMMQIIDGPIIRAHAISGAVVLSLRGGDYELTVGQDMSIGYAYHSRDEVELYLTESFTFRVLEPVAALRIAPTP